MIEANQALNIINQMTSNFRQPVNMNSLTQRLLEQGIEKKRIRRVCSWHKIDDDNRGVFFITPSCKEHSRYDKNAVTSLNSEKAKQPQEKE